MFITTANTLMTIPPALLDRLEVIEFPGYIEEEKITIAERFLIPRQLEETGIESLGMTFSIEALQRIVREYTYEAGVRNLEREIGRICRKVARWKAEEKRYPTDILPELIEKFLGPQQFFQTEAERKDEVGVATGLAWTENGGEIISIEVAVLDGKGNLQMTGQIGDVMQESGQAALTYVKSRAPTLGIDLDVFERMDIHVHMPEGAIPKDGPSAGITLATALVSALTGRAVHKEVGMTGEITLRGRVLPIGGLREKVLAAHRAGLKVVLIPEKNMKDLVDVPRKVREDLKIVALQHMDQVLEMALASKRTLEPPHPRRKLEEAGEAAED
jgi:ATP-dependent Lon protease